MSIIHNSFCYCPYFLAKSTHSTNKSYEFELTLSSFRWEGKRLPDLTKFWLAVSGHWKKHSSKKQRGTWSDSRSGTSSSGATGGRSGAEKISRLLFGRLFTPEKISLINNKIKKGLAFDFLPLFLPDLLKLIISPKFTDLFMSDFVRYHWNISILPLSRSLKIPKIWVNIWAKYCTNYSFNTAPAQPISFLGIRKRSCISMAFNLS